MQPVHIIGILNITPDSFYDGGKHMHVHQAMTAAEKMIKDGADVIEVGGESALLAPVITADEELQRVVPVIQELRKQFPHVRLSIDTHKSPVAKAAIDLGVSIVNDVTAGRGDPELFSTVAESTVDLVLMYSKDPKPPATIEARDYDDVVSTIKQFLAVRKQAAVDAGIADSRIILDPGLGHFISSKSEYSYTIIDQLKSFAELGSPILISPSRKSFLAGPQKLPPADRLPATIAASAICVMHGATYVRTHDVLEVRRACEIIRTLGH